MSLLSWGSGSAFSEIMILPISKTGFDGDLEVTFCKILPIGGFLVVFDDGIFSDSFLSLSTLSITKVIFRSTVFTLRLQRPELR